MTVGQKIKKLRIYNLLTQRELADKLNVTFQTVSKWENDENEPDISTLRELSKIFNCSIDELLNVDQAAPKAEPKPVQPAPATTPVVQTTVIYQGERHECNYCHKPIDPKDLVESKTSSSVRSGKTSRTVYHTNYYHRDCLEQKTAKDEENRKIREATRANKGKRNAFIWGTVAGVVGLGIALAVLLGVPEINANLHPALAVLFSVLIGYALFADLYCIITGSYIGEVFVGIASKSIHMPGIIFSWDISGFVFAIVMKVVFVVLGLMISVGILGLAIAISAILAAVSFPFVLVHNINTHYVDCL